MAKWFLNGMFTFMGLLFFFIGIFIHLDNKEFQEKADVVLARIVQIDEYKEYDDGETEYYYDVFVNYEYNGEFFEYIEIDTYTSSMREGKEIELYVDPSNPMDARYGGGDILFLLCFSSIGGLFALIGISMSIKDFFKMLKNKKIKLSGRCYRCFIVAIEEDYSFTSNGRPSLVAVCSYGEKTFRSKHGFRLKYDDLNKTVNVYVDEYSGEYFVDLKSIE